MLLYSRNEDSSIDLTGRLLYWIGCSSGFFLSLLLSVAALALLVLFCFALVWSFLALSVAVLCIEVEWLGGVPGGEGEILLFVWLRWGVGD